MTVLDTTFGGGAVDVDRPDPEDLRLWSVTSILREIDRGEGLMVWACRQAVACALDERDYVAHLYEWEGRQAAIDYCVGARFRAKADQLTDADLGTAFHQLAEQYAITGSRPGSDDAAAAVAALGPSLSADAVAAETDVLCRMLDRYDAWLELFQPTWEAAEFVVYSPTYGYAGTCDGVLVIPEQADADRLRVINDFKTTRRSHTGGKHPKPKRPYPETVLQLAAYRYAEFAAGWAPRRWSYYSRRYYLLSAGERAVAVPVPEVDGAVCILVTPDWCEAFPMRADRAAFDAFLYVLEVARWTRQTSYGAVGDPLIAPAAKEM